MGQKVYNFFITYLYFTERCHFKSDSQKLSLKSVKTKIFFLKEYFNFLEMEHVIDICAEGREAYFHSPNPGQLN